MSATVEQVAAAAHVDPRDVIALLRMYPDDDFWVEEGVLSKIAADEVHSVLNPYCFRTVPEV